jgi:Sulfotransferase family
MALPTFFIIGAPKAGTTSLHFYLARHPEIQMSANKEPRFFAGPENGIPYPPGRIARRDEYEALFDPAVPVRGEASTDYATHPRRSGAPERIKELVPDAKFIYLVRDPLARTISHYKMRVAVLGERRSLQDALRDLGDPASPYVWPSLYASQLALYLEHFPRERILVVDQADLLSQRRRTLCEIFEFLAVDETIDRTEFNEVLSDGREWRAVSPRYLRFIDRFVIPPLRWVPVGVRRSLRGAVERRLWPAVETPTLEGPLLAQLSALYSSEAARLRELTGKGFASWSV